MSLLEYLTSRNPTIDSTNSRKGKPSANALWPPVYGCEDLDFNYDTVISIFGQVLKKSFDGPSTSPELSAKEKEVTDEESLRMGPLRDIIPKVNAALKFGIQEYYGDMESIEICSGGHAPKNENDDSRFRADLAMVRDSRKTSFGYVNLCPGEVKLATKWSLDLSETDKDTWELPLSQIQGYAAVQWEVRWGFIITQNECVVARISRPDIGPGIASSRSRREPQHTRVPSFSTVISSMSRDSSSYRFNAKDVEYNSLQVTRALWADYGDRLTVKLLLWAMGMMVAGGILTVESHYPPLDSWVKDATGYRHATTGLRIKKAPKGGTILREPSGEASSTTEEPTKYTLCRVRISTITRDNSVGIRKKDGSYIWTPRSDWNKRGTRYENDEYQVYYEEGEESISDNTDDDEDGGQEGVAPETNANELSRAKGRYKGKGKGKEQRR